MNVNFDINAMLKSVIEDFQNIARNVKILFKIRRLNDDNHRFNGETDCHCKHKQGPRGILCTRGEKE
jgi:hypothetical protein